MGCPPSLAVGAMAPLPDGFTYGQWSLVYNALSFGIAGMGCATWVFWLQLPNVTKNYRTALAITGLVTAIATYHYVRIFNSWCDAFEVTNSKGGDYTVKVSGAPFNDAYRYVDWLLTVPLLLIELILVMKLPKDETVPLSWKLGLASAVMVALGYPGEIQDDLAVRWKWWAAAMVPFAYVVLTLSPRRCLEFSFGPSRRGSPRRRKWVCLSELDRWQCPCLFEV